MVQRGHIGVSQRPQSKRVTTFLWRAQVNAPGSPATGIDSIGGSSFAPHSPQKLFALGLSALHFPHCIPHPPIK